MVGVAHGSTALACFVVRVMTVGCTISRGRVLSGKIGCLLNTALFAT